ncbi:biorientation of chromosomes in cell division protein 1-like 1 isoform X2 [Macrobrachium rosenbergii]|uniref:biorientation of chromosomes in cell division protein 1-like 1 isoform X2 n=1 Tax=Macrobrachium rosenbergii TaxID=79674 RepID=UPI0034D6EE57
MDAYENDSHDGSFEEESFVDESFDAEEVFTKARNNFSNIIDKYICLSHGLASPAFIADRAIEISIPKRSFGRKIFVEENQTIVSEQITSQESLECENPIQEEIERTLLRRKQELGLPNDYVSEELQLGNGIKVSDIGLGDEGGDGNTGMKYDQEADKELHEVGKQEKEGKIKEKGANRKQKKEKKLQEKKPRGRPRVSTSFEVEKQKVGEIEVKKSRGRPRKSTSSKMSKQEAEGETKAKKPRGRPRGSTSSEIKKEVEGETKVKKSCGRPRKSTSSKMNRQEAEEETKAKKPRGRPRRSTASEIGKREINEETKAKKPCGRPKKSSTSELFNNKRKRELLRKIKESSGSSRQSTDHEVNKNKTEKNSRLSKTNISESDKYDTEQESMEDYDKPNKDSRCEGPKVMRRKRGRPKKIFEKLKSSRFYSTQNKKINARKYSFSELYAKSSQKYKGSSDDIQRLRVDDMKNIVARDAKSADINSKPFWNKSVSRYFKHLVTFGVSREQGHISLCPSLDLIIVHPLKKDDCLGVSSFPLPSKVLFAIPFVSKSTVSEKDIDEGVTQKSRSDCTSKATYFGGSVNNDDSSKIPHIKENVTNKRSSQKNSCHGLSNKNLSESHGEHSCKQQKPLKYNRNFSNIKHSVSANEISGKPQNVNLKDDLQPVVDCEYQLKDKEPQKSQGTRLLENKKVLYSNENSTGEKDGAQMVSKMEKVLLGQNYTDPTKQRRQKSKEKRGFCSENLVNDESHNEKELDLPTTHVSPVVESTDNNRNTEQSLSPEEECEVRCKEKKHSSAYVRKGKRPRKFKESRNIRCNKRKKMEASLYPSTSFTGSAKSRKLDSKKRERKLSHNSPPNKDCSNMVNRSLADVFQYSDDESNCEDSLNLVSKDCQSAFIDGKMPKGAKEYVVSDCIKTNEHTEVNVSNSCSRNSRLELKKSFRNEDCSLKLSTEIENNSRIVAQDLKNDSNKESTTNSKTSLPEKCSDSGKGKEKFPVLEGNHEESVVAGIDVVKKKRINIVARNKVPVHSNQYISSIMPGEETCPSSMNSCVAEPPENGVLNMQEAVLKKMPKKDVMSQLEANEEDEDSDGFQDSLNLLPVEKSSVSVGSYHSSLFHFLKLRKLHPQNCVGESVSLHPENNASNGANFTGKSTSVQSKVPSFFDISDDEDHLMDLPSSVETDHILDLPSRVMSSFSKNRSIGFSFQKKSSKQVPQQHNFMYKGKVVDIMKFL